MTPDDTYTARSDQWGIYKISLPSAWNIETGSENVYDIEDVYPALGSLLRLDLLDHTPKDDGTAMYVYNAKYAICEQIAERVRFYIQLREVFEALSFGIPLDFDDKYAPLTQGIVTQCYTFTGTFETEYRFRSIKSYFQFLFDQLFEFCSQCCPMLLLRTIFHPKDKKNHTILR